MANSLRLNELESVLTKHNFFDLIGLDRIGVFGSYARGDEYNDIDLLLEKEPGYKMRKQLADTVSKAMLAPCDVVVLDSLEPIMKHYILKEIQYVKKQ